MVTMKRGRKMTDKMMQIFEVLGVDTSKGSVHARKEAYYKTKAKVFTDLGYACHYNPKKMTLSIEVNGEKFSSKEVFLKYKNPKVRVSPINESIHWHEKDGYNEPRNTFSDFVLDYVNGSLSYKKLLSIAKRMYPHTVK